MAQRQCGQRDCLHSEQVRPVCTWPAFGNIWAHETAHSALTSPYHRFPREQVAIQSVAVLTARISGPFLVINAPRKHLEYQQRTIERSEQFYVTGNISMGESHEIC